MAEEGPQEDGAIEEIVNRRSSSTPCVPIQDVSPAASLQVYDMIQVRHLEGARQHVETRNTERSRQADVVLISGLEDDVLLHVLALVADARDVVCTGTLSRRWLRLWMRVPALRFTPRPVPMGASGAERCAALDQYISFVNNILTRRTQSNCAIESLDISYTTGYESETNLDLLRKSEDTKEQLMPALVDGAQGWIQYAFRYGVKSFIMDIHLLPEIPDIFRVHYDNDNDDDKDYGSKNDNTKRKLVVLLDELPSPTRLETIRLALGRVRLRLSATMKFTSLKDLSLERVKIVDGAHLLARLLSSMSCPCLQKLRMNKLLLPNFSEEMRLEADVLLELWVEDVNVAVLELRTPRLRVLLIDNCCHEVLRVSAPRLEEVALLFQQPGCSPRQLEVNGDLPHVRILKLCIWSHRNCASYYSGKPENNASMLFLKHCSSLTCLDVTLHGRKVFEEDVDVMKSTVPHLPHITSLTVNVSLSFDRHDFGVGVANLLTRLSNLRHIILHLPVFHGLNYNLRAGIGFLCDHPDHWISDEISMVQLQEVELHGLTGTDCELWFMKAVLASARGIHKVAINFNPKCRQHQDKIDVFEHMLLDEGMRASRRDTHMLTFRK